MADEERRIEVDEPELSAETNRALTEDVRAAVGSDRTRGAGDRRRPRASPHRSGLRAGLAADRRLIVVALLAVLIIGAIVSLTTGSWWFVLVAVAVHALVTVILAGGALRVVTDVERPDPSTAARLRDEGVGDPEATFNELVEHYAGSDPRGAADVLAPGHNERTVGAEEDPGRSAVEQRTAVTPGSRPERPGGESSAIAFLPWFVVGALVVGSVVVAVIVGGRMWLAPALMVPLGVAWIALDRLTASSSPDGAGARGRGPRRLFAVGAAIVVCAVAVVGIVLVVALG